MAGASYLAAGGAWISEMRRGIDLFEFDYYSFYSFCSSGMSGICGFSAAAAASRFCLTSSLEYN